MNIKVGQWVRLNKENTIVKVIAVFDDVVFDNDFNEIKKNNINKVKDTPRELVQEGDWIGLKYGGVLQIDDVIMEKSSCYSDERHITFNEIVSIYTPNADKTQYTLQWKKE